MNLRHSDLYRGKLFLQSLRPVEPVIVPTRVLGVDAYFLFKPLRE